MIRSSDLKQILREAPNFAPHADLVLRLGELGQGGLGAVCPLHDPLGWNPAS